MLEHVVAYNGLQRRLAARLEAWQAWRTLVEVGFSNLSINQCWSLLQLLASEPAAGPIQDFGLFASPEAHIASFAALLTAVLAKATISLPQKW